MSAAKQMKLVEYLERQMLLHLLALAQDHRWRWHLAGVVRELRVPKR